MRGKNSLPGNGLTNVHETEKGVRVFIGLCLDLEKTWVL